MPTLKLHLAAMPVHDLRSIASRLGVLARQLQRKPELIAAIAHTWEDAGSQQRILATLSPAARDALAHLRRVTRTPAALFFAEYGAVRHARTQPPGDPPWRQPASVAEELYYAALLGAFDLKPLRTTAYLCTPGDLLQPAARLLSADQPIQVDDLPADNDTPAAWTLAYDVAQWLLLLHELALTGVATFATARSRWPGAQLAQRLNRRLAAPAPEPLPRAPAHHHRLRLVLFLAAAAGLHQATTITPLGWTWLAEPPEQQTALLWRTWLDASPLLRQQYAFADGLIPRPWPTPLLHALQATPAQATPAHLAEHMLQQAHLPDPFWVHQVASLTALNRLVAQVLHQALLPFGLVVRHHHERGVRFSLTALGRYLLNVDRGARPQWRLAPAPSATPDAADAGIDPAPAASASARRPLLYHTDDGWRVELPADTPAHLQAALTPYAAHLVTAGDPPAVVQHYAITHATLARAISAGFGWPQLAAALEPLTFALTSPPCVQLAAHFARIPVITLQTQTLLHVADRATLQTLLVDPVLRPLIDDLLTATAATLHADPAVVSQRLQAAGYAVRADLPQTPAPHLPTAAALWLAGSLYHRLADLLPLPLPLLPAQLDALLAGLTPVQRSTLTAYREQLAAALLDLLEGRIYAPPTFTTDVAAHRQRLEAAAAAHRPVAIDYFSPARNLLTRRPIQPYWIEPFGRHLYLRAECLLTGRVLLFRLDRIQGIEEGMGD
jgi:hypothetical protein